MRRNVRIPVIALCLSLFFCLGNIQAKTIATPAFSAAKIDTTGWVLQGEVNGVKAYYKVDKCGLFAAVFLKFVNTNSYTVMITWDDQALIAGNSIPVKVNDQASALEMPPGSLFAEDCSNPPFPQLISRPAVTPEDIIQSFVFLNLHVTPK